MDIVVVIFLLMMTFMLIKILSDEKKLDKESLEFCKSRGYDTYDLQSVSSFNRHKIFCVSYDGDGKLIKRDEFKR